MGEAALAAEVAFLDVLLGVIPSSACIRHEYGEREACAEAAKLAGRKESAELKSAPYYPSGFEVIIHVILGLPGETREDMLETVRYLSLLTPPPDGIKLQLLHILKGTALAREYEADPFPLFTLDSYCDLVVDCLRLLPPETVVHRITGDGPKRLLIAPQWSADKKRVLNTLNRRIREA